MDIDGTLNIFEQRPIWSRLAINLAFCFCLSGTIDVAVINEKLQNALVTVASNFPWITGEVITEGRNAEGNSGVSKIVSGVDMPRLITKDHREAPSIPSMQQLGENGHPVSVLDESVFAPRAAAVAIPFEARPVLLVQANIVHDGLVLVFSGDHAAMDMPGLLQIIRWFSKACHNDPLPSTELTIGNMSRRDLIPLLGPTYQSGEGLTQQIPPTSKTGVPLSRQSCTWATFKIPSRAVRKIKATAMATCTSPFVSTDDSLSAFIWQSVARARVSRLAPETICKVVRAIDVRKVLGIPSDYPGLVQNNLFHQLPVHELSTCPLGTVASMLREAIVCKSPSLEFYSRALATSLSRTTDKSSLRVGANLDLSSDLLLSSSTTSGAYQLDFALGLGLPDAVRMTCQDPFESMTYLLPFTPEGDAAILICLRGPDLTAMMADESFSRFAQYVG
ncbi:hypothetical protein MBLNU13_g00046t1 [Cladosporium sp. NU13]